MPSPETWRNVGVKIRYLRKTFGLTQRQLASGCGLSVNTISMVERSAVCANIETLCKIANALGVTPGSLFLDVLPVKVVNIKAKHFAHYLSSLSGIKCTQTTILLILLQLGITYSESAKSILYVMGSISSNYYYLSTSLSITLINR